MSKIRLTKQTLKNYDCTCIEDYFDMIIESSINGQIGQVNSQVGILNNRQLVSLIKWCDNYVEETVEFSTIDDYRYVKSVALSKIK